MAAGLGFKTFTTGEVLTAGDVNGYLMQGVLVFASAAARNSAITSPQEGQFAFTKDTNGLWYYDGAAWVASGATGDIEGVTAGVGITGGGTSGTVTVTNDMATTITTAGDLIKGTGSGTYDRLGIGSTGQVLTVASGAPSWATPAASGMTFIQRGTFSVVANTGTTFDGVFSSTYKTYLICIENSYAATAPDDFYFQLRYAGPTTQAATYIWTNNDYTIATGVNAVTAANGVSQWQISNDCATSSERFSGQYWLTNAETTRRTQLTGVGLNGNDGKAHNFYGYQYTDRTYTGFILSSSSSNISGTVAVYGLATA